VARYCHVTVPGVLKWIKSEKLKAYCTPGGHYRVERQDFRQFLEGHGMPIEESFFLGTQLKVLVVDDEPEIREVICNAIDSMEIGAEIDTATDGYEAGMKVERSRPHLVVLDLKMPGMDGFEVCSKIKGDEVLAGIKVLAMTGYYTQENVARITECGANGILSKPFTRDQLLDKMDEIVGEEFPVIGYVKSREASRK
jgi:excisionase family DNA binding protein